MNIPIWSSGAALVVVALVGVTVLTGCKTRTSGPLPASGYVPPTSRTQSPTTTPAAVSVQTASEERGGDPMKRRGCDGFCAREAGRAAADLCSGSARGNLSEEECMSATGRAGYNECMRGCMGL